MRTVILLACLAAGVYSQKKPKNLYIVDENSGKAYKIMYASKIWSKAEYICEREGARLAVPKTQNEFDFIQKLVRGMYFPDITGTTNKLLVWVGINNRDNYKIWRNRDGENIENTGYHTWARNNGNSISDDPAEPHCAGMDAVNHGFRHWWCHLQQPYVCEKSL